MSPQNTGLCGLESEEICELPMATVFWGLPAEPLNPRGIQNPGQRWDWLCQRCSISVWEGVGTRQGLTFALFQA